MTTAEVRGGIEPPGRVVLVATALLTVAMAVFSDLAAGEPPLHVVTLGAVVAVIAGVRVHLGGRHRGMLQFVCAGVGAQPVLHAAVKLVPHGPLSHGHGSEIGRADLAVTLTQILLVVVVVAAICLAEQLVVAVGGVVRACWLRLMLRRPHPAPGVVRRRPAPAPARPRRLLGRGTTVKRGPPRRIVAA